MHARVADLHACCCTNSFLTVCSLASEVPIHHGALKKTRNSTMKMILKRKTSEINVSFMYETLKMMQSDLLSAFRTWHVL